MGKPKPESRLDVAKRQADLVFGLVLDLNEELNEARKPDSEADTTLFLLDELQSSLAKTRSQVERYFQERQ